VEELDHALFLDEVETQTIPARTLEYMDEPLPGRLVQRANVVGKLLRGLQRARVDRTPARARTPMSYPQTPPHA
jgi:hypothetical protein